MLFLSIIYGTEMNPWVKFVDNILNNSGSSLDKTIAECDLEANPVYDLR